MKVLQPTTPKRVRNPASQRELPRNTSKVLAHQPLPKLPKSAEDARQFLMKYKKDSIALCGEQEFYSGFAMCKSDYLLRQSSIIHRRISKVNTSLSGFGIPSVRGIIYHNNDPHFDNSNIEVPIPGWFMRGLRLSGPANTRDMALFFRIAALCNEFVSIEEHSESKSCISMPDAVQFSWQAPSFQLYHNLFHNNIQRYQASLRRLHHTLVTATNDVISPQRKLKKEVSLLYGIEENNGISTIIMHPDLMRALLKPSRYGYVNIKTVTKLKSMYGLRTYLLAQGYAAQGSWNSQGGTTKVTFERALFKRLMNCENTADGIFKRDVISQIETDLKRVESLDIYGDNYDFKRKDLGKERSTITIDWHIEDYNNISGPRMRLNVHISIAMLVHQRKHKSDTRLDKFRYLRFQEIDIDKIRQNRNDKRRDGQKDAISRKEELNALQKEDGLAFESGGDLDGFEREEGWTLDGGEHYESDDLNNEDDDDPAEHPEFARLREDNEAVSREIVEEEMN